MRITKLFAFVAAAALFSVACEPITGGGEEQKPDTTTITLSVDNSVVGIDSAVTFTVMNGEEDVTSECTFYNAATDEVVSNPYTTPMEEGIFEFYATWGFYQSNTVAVEVTTETASSPIPSLSIWISTLLAPMIPPTRPKLSAITINLL